MNSQKKETPSSSFYISAKSHANFISLSFKFRFKDPHTWCNDSTTVLQGEPRGEPPTKYIPRYGKVNEDGEGELRSDYKKKRDGTRG